MKTALFAAAAAIAIAASPAAAVTYVYAFTTVNGDVGTGHLTTAGPGFSPITSVTGTFDGSAVTGLSSYAGSDNNLNPAGPYFSVGGFSVSTASGVNYNWYFDGSYHLLNSVTSPGGFEVPHDMIISSVSAVPEPETWAMLGLGFGIVGAAARRRKGVSIAA